VAVGKILVQKLLQRGGILLHHRLFSSVRRRQHFLAAALGAGCATASVNPDNRATIHLVITP